MIKELDITKPNQAKEVLAIQRASYQVEAALIDFDDLPPLKENVQDLQQCKEMFFGFYLDDELCGVISIKTVQKKIDIHRLMVHPNHFKKGIAQQLLVFIESQYENFEAVIVTTGSKNTPAVNFYLKNGFIITEEILVAPGLYLTAFEKKLV